MLLDLVVAFDVADGQAVWVVVDPDEGLFQQAGELVDRGKQAVQEQKDRLASAVEAGREAYRSAPGSVGT